MTSNPCKTCTRVIYPPACDDKNCQVWRAWFTERWEHTRRYPRRMMDAVPLVPAGVSIGGNIYLLPHQRRHYLQHDPCENCPCPREFCSQPCKHRAAWERARQEVTT